MMAHPGHVQFSDEFKCKEILNHKHSSRYCVRLPPGSIEMRTVSIWASGLLASAIPFMFVGAVIAFAACVFDAVGQHAPPAPSKALFHPEAAPPEEVLTVASAGALDERQPNKRQAGKHAHGDARHHHSQSRSHSRVRSSPFEFGWPFANHFAKPNYPARPFANLQ